MKRIAYKKPDGSVAVVVPAPNWVTKMQKQGKSEAEIMDALKAKSVPAGVTEMVELDSAAIPTDRTFRNAWGLNAGNVEVDMPKAREIHMGRIREARDAKLKELDIESMKNLEAGRDNSAVAAQKDALRNLPQTFNLNQYQSPDALKAAWPAELL